MTEKTGKSKMINFNINPFLVYEDKIDRLLKDIVKNNKDEYSRESFKESATEILRLIGEALFKATRVRIKNPDLYFWPGYDSFFDRKKQVRVLIKHKGVDCGIGFRNANEPYHYIEGLSGFDHVLGPGTRFQLNGKKYRPGSTHAWISQKDKPMLFTQKTGLVPLNIVEIKFNGNHYSAKSNIAKGLVSIILKKDDSENWGKRIASVLNDKKGRHWSQLKKGEVILEYGKPWPLTDTEDDHEKLKEVRQKLYSVWLATCFKKNWNELNWIKPFLSSIGIEHNKLLKKVVKLNCKDSYSKSKYKYWYTIGLTKTMLIETNEKEEGHDLGSLMFLSNYKLDTNVLYLMKNWVESIYLRLRSLEDQYYLKEITEKREKTETTSKWAHALKTRFLLTKSIIAALKKGDLDEKRKARYLKIMDNIYESISQALTGIQETLRVNREMMDEEYRQFSVNTRGYIKTKFQDILVDSLKTALNRVLVEPDQFIYTKAREKLFKEEWQGLIGPGFEVMDGEKFESILFSEKISIMRLDTVDKIETFRDTYLKNKSIDIEIGAVDGGILDLFDFRLWIPDKKQNSPQQLPIKFIISSLLDECILNTVKHSLQNDPQIRINISLHSSFKNNDTNHIKIQIKNRIENERETEGAKDQPLIRKKVDRELIWNLSKTRNGLGFIDFMANLLYDYDGNNLRVWDVEESNGINYFTFNLIIPVFLKKV